MNGRARQNALHSLTKQQFTALRAPFERPSDATNRLTTTCARLAVAACAIAIGCRWAPANSWCNRGQLTCVRVCVCGCERVWGEVTQQEHSKV